MDNPHEAPSAPATPVSTPKPSLILSLRGLRKDDRVRIQARLDALRQRQNRVCVQLQLVEEHLARAEAQSMPSQEWRQLASAPGQLGELWQLVLREVKAQEGIDESHILNAWQWGSRWFGDNVPSSDFDFMLVIKGWQQPRGKHYHVVKAPRVDICMFSEGVFAELIANLHSWTLAFMSYPPHGILVERRRYNFTLELPRLQQTVRADDVSNYTVAKRFWNRGKIRKAKKRVCFILRMLDYGVQIAREGAVRTHQNFNDLFHECLVRRFEDWNDLKAWSEPHYTRLTKQLAMDCSSWRQFETLRVTDAPQLPLLVRFLNARGANAVQDLQRYLSIRCRVSNESFLYRSTSSSPVESQIVRQCNGLLLDSANKVICYPPIAAQCLHKHPGHTFRWSTAKYYVSESAVQVTAWLDGTQVRAAANTCKANAAATEEAFLQYWNNSSLSADYTFTFERTTSGFHLVFARNRHTLAEVPPASLASLFHLPTVTFHPIASLQDANNLAGKCFAPGVRSFIFIDEDGKRLKMHAYRYTILRTLDRCHAQPAQRRRHIIICLLNFNDALMEDICATLPEVKGDVIIIRSCLTTALTEIDQVYNDCDKRAATSKDVHKRFQDLARQTFLSPILLQMRKQKCSAKECLSVGRSLAIGLQDAIVDAVEAKLKLLHALPAPVVTKPAPDDD